MWKIWNTHTSLVGMQNSAATPENNLLFSKILNIELPYDPSILLLGLYPKELKTGIQAKICTQMFTAGLFTITKSGNNPNVNQVMNGIFKCGIFILRHTI